MSRRWHVLPSEIMKCSPEEMALNFFVLDAAMSRESETIRNAEQRGGLVVPAILIADMS